MGKEISTREAAQLALEVYDVNSGHDRLLRAFLGNRLFMQGPTSSQVLKAEVGGRLFRAAKDAFGVCATGAGAYQGDLFLVFRGTTTANNKADFVTDARIGLERSETGWPVHVGFNHAFKAMLPEIRKTVAEEKITGTVHCIGHSLGGAVASLAADWAASSLSVPIKLYAFGQPRVGLSMFSVMLTKKLGVENIHRVFHTTDPVPMVPVFPYLHSPLPGYGRRVISENPIVSAEAHSMKMYSDHMSKKKWDDFSLAPPLNTHADAIKEWLRSSANSNPNCPKTFEWLESALIWLPTKQLSVLTHGIQWTAMGIHTFLDKVAWVLAKGVELKDKCSEYVKLFLYKVAKVLGIRIPSGTSLTRAFLRFLLETLTRRACELALKAIRQVR
jgi:triacylglycerol lipase